MYVDLYDYILFIYGKHTAWYHVDIFSSVINFNLVYDDIVILELSYIICTSSCVVLVIILYDDINTRTVLLQ